MAESTFPVKGVAYTFYIMMLSQADKDTFQVNPTLAEGDVKVSTDGGALANITTLPVVTPAGSKLVKVDLSAAEMNGDHVNVVFSDAAGDEWCDWIEPITPLSSALAAQVNAEVVDVLRTDLIPDSYAADGAQPTIAQALLAVHQFLTDKAVSGTTVTVRKPDGNTAAMTFTLDSATAPTTITRAS